MLPQPTIPSQTAPGLGLALCRLPRLPFFSSCSFSHSNIEINMRIGMWMVWGWCEDKNVPRARAVWVTHALPKQPPGIHRQFTHTMCSFLLLLRKWKFHKMCQIIAKIFWKSRKFSNPNVDSPYWVGFYAYMPVGFSVLQNCMKIFQTVISLPEK